MGLNEAIRLDLDRAGDAPVNDRNQARDAGRGQRAIGPLDIIRVLGPALRGDERDQLIEVSLRKLFNRCSGHEASLGSPCGERKITEDVARFGHQNALGAHGGVLLSTRSVSGCLLGLPQALGHNLEELSGDRRNLRDQRREAPRVEN